MHTSQACRNVKFSSSPVDLLAFSEHTGRVQLLDSRCYGSKQRLLATPGVHPGRHISGLAFSPSVKLPSDVSRILQPACVCEMYESSVDEFRAFAQGLGLVLSCEWH